MLFRSMVFLLHQKTMDENYSLEKLAAECIQSRLAQDGVSESEPDMEEEEGLEEYDRAVHDWIAEQERGSPILRETDTFEFDLTPYIVTCAIACVLMFVTRFVRKHVFHQDLYS